MHPDPIKPDDVVTPWMLKYVFLPLLVCYLLFSFGQGVMNDVKCSREAKRQGYLEGRYVPGDRFGSGRACLCERKLLPDGRVDDTAKMTIELENRSLSW